MHRRRRRVRPHAVAAIHDDFVEGEEVDSRRGRLVASGRWDIDFDIWPEIVKDGPGGKNRRVVAAVGVYPPASVEHGVANIELDVGQRRCVELPLEKPAPVQRRSQEPRSRMDLKIEDGRIGQAIGQWRPCVATIG